MPNSIREDAFALLVDLMRFIAVVPKLFDPGTLFPPYVRMSFPFRDCPTETSLVRLCTLSGTYVAFLNVRILTSVNKRSLYKLI